MSNSKLKLFRVISLIPLLYGGFLHAAPAWQPSSIGGGISYTDDAHDALNIEVGWQFNSNWRIKVQLEQGLYSREHAVSLVSFAESFERKSFGVFAQRNLVSFPRVSLSAGLVHFDKASTWIASPERSAVYHLNGRSYSGLNLGRPEATVSYRTLIPYFGVSWSSLPPNKKGWGISANAGVMFNLDPELMIKSNNPSGLAYLNADLQHEADKYVERLKSEDEFLNNVAPRVGMAVIYQF